MQEDLGGEPPAGVGLGLIFGLGLGFGVELEEREREREASRIELWEIAFQTTKVNSALIGAHTWPILIIRGPPYGSCYRCYRCYRCYWCYWRYLVFQAHTHIYILELGFGIGGLAPKERQ